MEVTFGYKQTEVGIIPEEWNVSRLAKVADVRGGIAKNSNVTITDPISVNYLRVANVQDGFLDLTDLNKIEISRQDLKRYSVLPGDVLMNEGGDLDQLGRGAVWKGEFSPCVHQNHVFVVRCKSLLLPEFLDIWTGTQPARKFFLLAGKQTTNLASISKSSLGELPVALPHTTEQRAIAAALSDVDALLDGLGRLIAKKRDLKQAAMQQLLTGKTRLPGFHSEWDAKELKQIVQTPITDGPHLTPRFLESGIPFLSVNNLVDNKIDFSDLRFISLADHDIFSRKCKPRKGDILLGKAASVGKVALVESDMDFNIWSPIAMIRVSDSHDPRFIYYQLQCADVIRQIKLLTNSSSQGNIGMGDIELLRLALPLLREQSAIASVLSDIDTELLALSSRLDKTRALKQAMMQELLTGKTRLVPIGDTSCLNNPVPNGARRTA